MFEDKDNKAAYRYCTSDHCVSQTPESWT